MRDRRRAVTTAWSKRERTPVVESGLAETGGDWRRLSVDRVWDRVCDRV